jgi:hypothetical protein
MAMEIVTIVIDEQGDANVDIAGAQGKGCHAIQQAFEKAFGKATGGHFKPEYNRPIDTKTKLQNKG